ncbi:MAG: fibronectin type III domain-containing protein [bacterium]|nr:fibronectin type III domain-containing protein [bacterium]
MKKLLMILLALVLAFEGSATSRLGPAVIVDPVDHHRFLYEQQPIFLAGYYPGLQALVVEPQVNSSAPLTSTYYRQLLDEMAENELNLLRVVLTMGMALENRDWLHPYQRSGQCCTANSSDPIGVAGNRFDLDLFNESFFDYWDAVLTYAEQKGVVVQVALLDGAHTRERKTVDQRPQAPPFEYIGWIYDYYHSRNCLSGQGVVFGDTDDWYEEPVGVNRQRAFIAKAVEELGAHRNVIWEIANEPQVTPRPSPGGEDPHSWFDEMWLAIRNAENSSGHPPHLIQPFDLPEHRDVSGDNTPGHDPPTQQEFGQVHAGLVADYWAYDQPLIADNDCCYYNNGTTADLRKKAWLSLVSGAHPSLLVYEVTGGSNPLGLTGSETQQGMRFVGYTNKLIRVADVDLAGMEPRDDLVAAMDGGTAWCLAREDEEYIVYFFDSSSASISGLAGYPIESTWLNPRNGEDTDGPTMGGYFPTPGSGDWVLHVRRLDNLPPATPTNVQASDGDFPDRIRVTWDEVPGATSYKVYRRSAAISWPPGGPSAEVTTTTYDSPSSFPVAYNFWVKAVNVFGESDYSEPDSGSADP